MSGIRIRFAEPSDAGDIACLFSSSFRPEIAQLLIYACKGATEYIRMNLQCHAASPESVYMVAATSEAIIGAAELRRQPERLLLNYIAVHPRYRGQRIAAALLSDAIGMLGVGFERMELDVFDDNVPALNWYSRLGFAIRRSAQFVEIALPSEEHKEPAYISGLPQADLCHEVFGFSTFNLSTSVGIFSVGRIGDTWLRCCMGQSLSECR